MELPEMLAPEAARFTVSTDHVSTMIDLGGRDYVKARAIPGAIYFDGSMKLPVVTPRAAIVALTLFPDLGNEYPELIEARANLIQDVHPTDYATPLGLRINAPRVLASLEADGQSWLEFEDEVQLPWPNSSLPDPGTQRATQETDLGYAAALLDKHHAAYLGWARGYGKTLGTCALIEANSYARVLIAVPNTSKQDVWLRELEKRGVADSHDVYVMPNDKAKRERLLEILKDKAKHPAENAPFVLVVHHEALALVAKHGPPSTAKVLGGWKRLGIEWDLFAFDEVHRLKSAGRKGSQLHKSACKVPSRHRLALSGSVYENSWEELYGPLHWLLPGRYHSKWETWNGRHFDYVEGYGKICVGILEGHEQALRDELGVFMLVREKTPKAIEHTVEVDLSPEQRRVYDELQNDFAVQLEDGTAILAQSGVVMLQKLRQIATGLELVSKSVADSTKLDAAMRVISDYKYVDDFFVACWYKASAYALRDRLIGAGYQNVYVITGDIPQKRRGELIAVSRADAAARHLDQPTILIGTIPTLGESANLQHLNHVIRLDRSFNPALNRQVVDRCDRTGQNRQVQLTDIVSRDTVDELVVAPNLANKDAFRALILGRPA